jgi:hypothetical protein
MSTYILGDPGAVEGALPTDEVLGVGPGPSV